MPVFTPALCLPRGRDGRWKKVCGLTPDELQQYLECLDQHKVKRGCWKQKKDKGWTVPSTVPGSPKIDHLSSITILNPYYLYVYQQPSQLSATPETAPHFGTTFFY
ncbi:hypothetical protein Gasu2_33780 [Galdieria sulphuraria]|nr:hypothetical protein Gasu2_33780 [Galdieria sulphuraria]